MVSLDQSSTETLLSLRAGSRMAGTANMKTKVDPRFTEEYGRIPVLSPKILTSEQLRAANPDFVVSAFSELYTPDRAGTREELEALGVRTFVSEVGCEGHGGSPFERLFRDFETLGAVLREPDRTRELVSDQRAVVEQVQAAALGRRGGLRVAWVYSVFKGVPFVAGRNGLPSDMSRLAGVVNVFDDIDKQWPEVSWETFAERAPDVIVVGDLSERGNPGDSADEKLTMMREHPALSTLDAIRSDRIIRVPGIEMDPSVRSVNALRTFSEELERFAPRG
ncbi:ABC transporter substrate-binding protein [Saccharothrix sp. SC076]|nr:ABC transporter substrate-binding protein [Saccharothrix obliqua]